MGKIPWCREGRLQNSERPSEAQPHEKNLGCEVKKATSPMKLNTDLLLMQQLLRAPIK